MGGDEVGVGVGVEVAVAVGVGVAVGDGRGNCAQYLPPLFKYSIGCSCAPPQMIISPSVQTAV